MSSVVRSVAARHGQSLTTIALALALVAAVVFLVWRSGSEGRALGRIPVPERRALYEQTFGATESLCDRARSDPALQSRCEDMAEFLESFPECDAACRALARSVTAHPTR